MHFKFELALLVVRTCDVFEVAKSLRYIKWAASSVFLHFVGIKLDRYLTAFFSLIS